MLFPWQERVQKFFAKRVWQLCLAIILLPYVVLMVRGVNPLRIVSCGFLTVACGATAPFLYFFILSEVQRKVDVAVRWLIPGKPTQVKLASVSALNLALYTGVVGLALYWWLSAPVSNLSGDYATGQHYTSGRAHMSLGSGFWQLAAPSVVGLCLVGASLEVFKLKRWIYPEPGLPEDLLDL
jgi:hypothetical protein